MKATAAVLLSLSASIVAAPVDPSPNPDAVVQTMDVSTGPNNTSTAVNADGGSENAPVLGAAGSDTAAGDVVSADVAAGIKSAFAVAMANSNSTVDGINGTVNSANGAYAPQRYTDAEQGLLDFANAATLGILGTVLKLVNGLTGGAVNFGLSVANGVTLGLVGNPVAGSTVKITPKVGVPVNQPVNAAGPSADAVAEALLQQLGVTNVGPVTINH